MVDNRDNLVYLFNHFDIEPIMTQQDKDRAAFEAQIELPPLPEWADRILQGDWRDEIISWAESAIAQDRQSRGEPVGEIHPDMVVYGLREGKTTFLHPVGYFGAGGVKVYTAPQPAEQPAASVKEIQPSDLIITTYHPVQVGSWSIRQPHGVRIVHRPTGLMAECHEGRSQHRNRAIAMERLAAAVQAKPVKVPSDADIAKCLADAGYAHWLHPIQITLGGSEIYGMAHALLARYGQPAQPAVKYVPADSRLRDQNYRPPNDDEPRTEACQAALDSMGDNADQGLDGYWKWGFAAGFNAALRAQPAASAEPMDTRCSDCKENRFSWCPHNQPEPEWRRGRPCKGLNCGAMKWQDHSPECEAQHAATIAGGTFLPAPVAARPSVPPYLSGILKEAAAIIKGIHPEFRPPTMRQPIIDELETLAAMFNVNEVKRKDAET